MESALSIKGQATIPKTIREHLQLKPGDRIKFFVHPDGSVVILPRLPTSSLKGMAARPRKRPASIEEMHQDVAVAATGGIRRARK